MTSSGGNIERAFASAKDQYAEWGVDVDLALARLSTIAISLHCWQGDDVGGLRELGPGDRGRPGGHRAISRQGTHARRAQIRPRQGAGASARLASFEPPRELCRDRRPEGRTRCARARALSSAGSTGRNPGGSAWISTRPISLIPSRPTATHWPTPIAEHPPVLDRSWDCLPADRRRDRQGARVVRA